MSSPLLIVGGLTTCSLLLSWSMIVHSPWWSSILPDVFDSVESVVTNTFMTSPVDLEWSILIRANTIALAVIVMGLVAIAGMMVMGLAAIAAMVVMGLAMIAGVVVVGLAAIAGVVVMGLAAMASTPFVGMIAMIVVMVEFIMSSRMNATRRSERNEYIGEIVKKRWYVNAPIAVVVAALYGFGLSSFAVLIIIGGVQCGLMLLPSPVTCVICMDATGSTQYKNCLHVLMCAPCHEQYVLNANIQGIEPTCPMCRKSIFGI